MYTLEAIARGRYRLPKEFDPHVELDYLLLLTCSGSQTPGATILIPSINFVFIGRTEVEVHYLKEYGLPNDKVLLYWTPNIIEKRSIEDNNPVNPKITDNNVEDEFILEDAPSTRGRPKTPAK